MQHKTSSAQFEKFGSVYKDPIDIESTDLIAHYAETIIKDTISQVQSFDCEVYIEMQSGMACIVVSETPEADHLELFAIHRLIKLKENIFFKIIPITNTVSYRLITKEQYNRTAKQLDKPFTFNRILPTVTIKEILGYYYSIRDSGYKFDGESMPYYELTYVDRGTLTTEVDGNTYTLKDHDLMIYGPGQFHNQLINKGDSCSYITIVFDLLPGEYDFLLNKVFPYNRRIHGLMKSFVNESTSYVPYMNSLMLSILQEIVIRLLQSEFVALNENEKPVTDARQHYNNELLEKILSFIDDTIYEPITIAEICQKFSMSRSSLQILFNENLNQSPKKYMSELKLSKSRQLISEGKYTISEIALMLGFNSIHYFSRAFTQKYNMAPTEYAKTMFKSNEI